MAGLHTEIWIRQLLRGFYPDSSFLKYAVDLSKLVDNDKINLAEAGMDPTVLINNTTYPIRIVQRIDTPIAIEMDKFETENTLIRRPETIEYAYDQLESVLKGHRDSLRAKTAEKAAHAYAPTSDSELTPVIKTTGEVISRRKRLSYVDIITLKSRYDMADLPLENRYLVLAPEHVSDLILQDVKLFKNITDLRNGQPFNFAGFNILQYSKPPVYELKNGVFEKVPFGTHTSSKNFCSFSFLSTEVMKADGGMYMYLRQNDPVERGSIVGFDKRFVALPMRNKGIGAIVSDVSE